MLVHLQYDGKTIYTFYKRFEDRDEQEALAEGALDVERIPAWDKVRADSGLRLNIVSGKPLLRGLVFLMHLKDERNLLVLGLSGHEAVEVLA